MDERYPYIRFVVDAAQVIAGAVAVIILLGGTLRACHHGGMGGLGGFLVALLLAVVAYVITMIKIEVLRVFLDIEQSTRQTLAAVRPASVAAPPPTPGPTA
jgi:hypothetical protein